MPRRAQYQGRSTAVCGLDSTCLMSRVCVGVCHTIGRAMWSATLQRMPMLLMSRTQPVPPLRAVDPWDSISELSTSYGRLSTSLLAPCKPWVLMPGVLGFMSFEGHLVLCTHSQVTLLQMEFAAQQSEKPTNQITQIVTANNWAWQLS